MTEVTSQLQTTNDVVLLYFVPRRGRFKPVLEASPSLLPTESLLCDVHLNRWTEIQENRRNCELELRQSGLKFTSLKLPCVL
jgi:hypothetical protein